MSTIHVGCRVFAFLTPTFILNRPQHLQLGSTGSLKSTPTNFFGGNNTMTESKEANLDSFHEFTPGVVPPKVTKPQHVSAEGVVTISSISEFLDFVNSDKDDVQGEKQLCVIKYHAHWCQVCHRVGIKYKKLALDFNQKKEEYQGRVRFGDVEVGANMELCKRLGVKKFPFVEIYEGGTKIAAFSTGPSYKFNLVRDTLIEKLSMTPAQKQAFLKEFNLHVEEGRQLLKDLEVHSATLLP